ncbi:Alpha/Beta hydrolase protein [Panaeolus papilionaceus]|nr:Alpha/Beta hydrolase protein [Panaeolus papilionaceus]
MGWFTKVRGLAKEAVPKWLAEIRKIYGADAKYSAVGYCFGGPYALGAAATDDVVAAAFTHPAGLVEDHFRNVKKPFLLSCAEVDQTFPTTARRRAEDILVEIKATYHVQVFSGVVHGFATRGDPEIENERWAKEESARSIIEWFIRFSNNG